MKDERIKLITKEIFIAWGMICIGFIVVDNIWHVFGITPFYTCQPVLKGAGAIAKAIIFYSNILTILIASLVAYIFRFLPFATTLFNVLIIMVQFFLYWYIGNLIGRFIVWIKNLRKKSLPESTTSPFPDN